MIDVQFCDKKFLIVGFGGMGCRHVQSLLNSGYKNIIIIEPDSSKIESGFKKINYNKELIKILPSFESLDVKCDFAIIATSAEPRYEITKNLIETGIKHFLIEKIVFQSLSQFDNVERDLKNLEIKTYCNFVNRYFPNYIKLRKKIIRSTKKTSVKIIAGDLGLATSIIHYLDLFEYLTGKQVVHSESLLKKWDKENKRGSNYIEFSGIFYSENERGDTFELYFDDSHNGGVTINIANDDDIYLLSEGNRVEYIKKSNQSFSTKAFEIIPTSKLTSKIVEDIYYDCTVLPSIKQTKNIHSHLFKECFKSLKQEFNREAKCPIT